MSDLHTQNQLAGGFYDLEAGAWRWTGKTFAVTLSVPQGGGSRGGILTLQGSVAPESVGNGPLEINSSVGGSALSPISISKPGQVIYRADVPPDALRGPLVVADFSLSNTHRTPGDLRDLGIIVSVISLHSK
jgi:hypothetical protein